MATTIYKKQDKQQQAVADIKIPPHSIEAEQSVLGGLMLDNDVWDKVAERLQASDFFLRDHQLIFRIMTDLAKRNSPFDVVTLTEALKSVGELDNASGEIYLFELAKNTPSVANIEAYVDIVAERSILRRLINAATEIADVAFHPDGRLSDEILDEAEAKVFQISQRQRQPGPQEIQQFVAKAVERVDELYRTGATITGLATSYPDFDNMTSGLQEADLVIIAGRPSMGKTMLAMNIAEHVSLENDKPVLVFSMEMPGESLALRLMSSLGRIDQHKIRSGKLNDEDWARVSSAVALLSKANLFIDDSPALTPLELRARARRFAKEQGQLGLIIIDYLQLMRAASSTDNRTAEISEISRALKALAKELNVPVIAISQLNRSLEQRSDKRPVMSDLRESGAIEQDADLIVFIYRDEVYNENSPDKGIAEIIIAKQRNGPIGKLRLTFLGQFTRFDNYVADNFGFDYMGSNSSECEEESFS